MPFRCEGYFFGILLVFLGAEELGILDNMVPALCSNLFVFKEKTKRISTSIGAKQKYLAFL